MQLINDEVRIESSNLCNGHCTICPRENLTRKLMTMNNVHYAYLIKQAVELGARTVSIFGLGEPLLDKDICWKVHHASKSGLKTFLTTNASLLTPTMAKRLLDSGLDHMRFSVHGIYGNYEKVHRGLKFQEVQRNIFNFLKMNEVQNGNRCRTDVSIIPMNNESIGALVRYWKGTVDDIAIWKPHGWGGAKKYREETKERLTSCGRPFSGPVQIQVDGTMIPCCFLTNSEIILGDTHKNTIEEILKSDEYNELRDRHRVGNFKDLPCEDCDQLYISDEPALLYSSDKNLIEGRTSSTKFEIETI